MLIGGFESDLRLLSGASGVPSVLGLFKAGWSGEADRQKLSGEIHKISSVCGAETGLMCSIIPVFTNGPRQFFQLLREKAIREKPRQAQAEISSGSRIRLLLVLWAWKECSRCQIEASPAHRAAGVPALCRKTGRSLVERLRYIFRDSHRWLFDIIVANVDIAFNNHVLVDRVLPFPDVCRVYFLLNKEEYRPPLAVPALAERLLLDLPIEAPPAGNEIGQNFKRNVFSSATRTIGNQKRHRLPPYLIVSVEEDQGCRRNLSNRVLLINATASATLDRLASAGPMFDLVGERA